MPGSASTLAGSSPGTAALASAARKRGLRSTPSPYAVRARLGWRRGPPDRNSPESRARPTRPRPARRAPRRARPARHACSPTPSTRVLEVHGDKVPVVAVGPDGRGRRRPPAPCRSTCGPRWRPTRTRWSCSWGRTVTARHTSRWRSRRAAGRGRRPRRRGCAALRQVGRRPVRPRRHDLRHRARARELARHPHALPALRRADRAGPGRLAAPLPAGRQRALPAHRRRGDHVGRRRPGPAAAGARARAGGRAGSRCWPGSSSRGRAWRRRSRARSTRRSGCEVHDVEYLGDQPWPFPNSLMVGFTAQGRRQRPAAAGVRDRRGALVHPRGVPRDPRGGAGQRRRPGCRSRAGSSSTGSATTSTRSRST